LIDKQKITQWRCPNCGQTFFGSLDELPSHCGICHQSIAWQEIGKPIKRWRCPNCGQTIFTMPDDKPPDMCHYCHDFTTWKRIYD